jgi:hypothetical protein
MAGNFNPAEGVGFNWRIEQRKIHLPKFQKTKTKSQWSIWELEI